LNKNLIDIDNFKIKYFQWLTPSGFKSLLALIGTNGQGVGTSAFQQWSNNCKKYLPQYEKASFENFVDNTYIYMEEGMWFKICLLKNYNFNIIYFHYHFLFIFF